MYTAPDLAPVGPSISVVVHVVCPSGLMVTKSLALFPVKVSTMGRPCNEVTVTSFTLTMVSLP